MAEATVKEINKETLDMLRAVSVFLQKGSDDPTTMHNAIALLAASVSNLFMLVNKQTEQHDIMVENIRSLSDNNKLIADSLQLLSSNFIQLATITLPEKEEEAPESKPASNFETKY